MKKFLKALFSRTAIMAFLMLIQIVFFALLIIKLSNSFIYIYTFFRLLGYLVVFYIVSQHTNPAHKLAWVIPILIFPVFGGTLYILLRTTGANKRFKANVEAFYQSVLSLLVQDLDIIDEIKKDDKNIANQSRYISAASNFPVYRNTETEYFASGEEYFVKIVEELKKAKEFIFIETFIIQEGLMWNTVLNILEEKASQGVDVRVMYDDAGCFTKLPHKYYETLRKMGIKCYVFNPFTPLLEIKMNNRDHRKITVIDGHTAFTGGINFADEYINAYEKYGHWKDAAILVKGEAAWNMTIMFLQLWGYLSKDTGEYEKFKPCDMCEQLYDTDGFVQPYGDSPLDNEPVGKRTYINMISRAKDYVYIFTPYLILDYEMVDIMKLAAKSGVDIRIVTPHIPDKWYVFWVTQSYYEVLIEAGVKIYEYLPGFMHSKAFLSDDEIAVVGSINLDYRSLYFHFECGVWLYKTQSIKAIKNDFIETFDKCKQITIEECKSVKPLKRIIRGLLRLFAPLM